MDYAVALGAFTANRAYVCYNKTGCLLEVCGVESGWLHSRVCGLLHIQWRSGSDVGAHTSRRFRSARGEKIVGFDARFELINW